MKKKTTLEEKVAEAEKNLRDAAIETAENIAKGIIDSTRGLKYDTPVIDEMHTIPVLNKPFVVAKDKLDEVFRDVTLEWPKSSYIYKIANTGESTDEEPEEWIWVEGYKGTDKDMKCRDFQFELGKEFYHEGDVSICHSGFHFCQKLEDVFDYYDIGRERRFFKVRALVNKKRYIQGARKDTSKAIIFTEELSQEDVLKVAAERHPEIKALPAIYFGTLFKRGVSFTVNEWRIEQLVDLGYSRALSDYIVTILREFSVAYALASQPGLSMDTKVNLIFNETKRRAF